MNRASILVAVGLFVALGGCREDRLPDHEADDILTLTVTMDQAIVADDDMDAVALIELDSSEVPIGERPPVSVALVLDTSGSMEGNKMDNARDAAHGLIDSLDVGDAITVIGFSDEAEAVLEEYELGVNRAEAHEAVDGLEARGNTCSSCGLELAYSLLSAREEEGLRRVILLSDGHANRGLQGAVHLSNLASNANEFWQIDTATIGLGRLHNEGVMAALAEGGAATYYFLHNSSYLAQILDHEIAGLHSTVLTDLVVRLQPGDGVIFTGTENTGSYWDGSDLVFHIGQLSISETRQLVVTMQLPAGDMGRAVFAQANFRDVRGADYRLEESARVQRSDDTVEIEHSANKLVAERFLQLTSARRVQDAMDQVEVGNRAEAVQMLEETALELDGYADAIGSDVLLQEAAELRDIRDTFAVEEDAEPMSEPEERGNVIMNRARSWEEMRGVVPQDTYHQPQMYDLSETE